MHLPRSLATIAVASVAALAAPAFGSASTNQLFTPVESPQKAAAGELQVRVDEALLLTAPRELEIALPDGTSVVAQRVGEVEWRGARDLTWRGQIEGFDGIGVTLTYKGGSLAGTVITHDGPFRVEQTPSPQLHRIRPRVSAYIDEGGVEPPRELVPVGVPVPAPAPVQDQAVKGIAGIDILIAYTPNAAAFYGGTGAMLTQAQNAVDTLNTAFVNSQIGARGRLVGTMAVPHLTSATTMRDYLFGIADDPQVQQRRNEVGADVVALFIAEADAEGCGLGFVMRRGSLGPGFAPAAYNVSQAGCEDHTTFAHEVGHNMGCEHDPLNGGMPSEASYPYAFGHLAFTYFKTIMAYGVDDTVPYFSTPRLSVSGQPLGRPNERDNARALDLTAPIVAGFRSGPMATAPAAPTDLAANAVSATEVELAWTDNANNETGFTVQARMGMDDFAQIASLGADVQSYTADGLDPMTEYDFRVRAVRNGAASAYSNTATATTLPDVPAAPTGLTAATYSATEIELGWTDNSDNETGFVIEATTPFSDWTELATAPAEASTYIVGGLPENLPHTFRISAINDNGFSASPDEATSITGGATGPCVADDETLCLMGGRFEARVWWKNQRAPFDSGRGQARAVPGSEQSGLFWFFREANIELIVKMVDGRSVNGAFWQFYGALSDVEYWLAMRDTEEAATVTYRNPPFEICGLADVGAFPAAGPGAAPIVANGAPLAALPLEVESRDGTVTRGTCTESETNLCLLSDRFSVAVDWSNPRQPGQEGAGQVADGIGTSQTGFFWFFRPENLELLVKMVDGSTVNGKYWVFWGGLSDIEYTVTVTDTTTGQEWTFDNPAYNLCGGADINAL